MSLTQQTAQSEKSIEPSNTDRYYQTEGTYTGVRGGRGAPRVVADALQRRAGLHRQLARGADDLAPREEALTFLMKSMQGR